MTIERFALVLEARPGDVPGVQRLRALLKLMLRGYGLKAIELRELSPDAPDSPQDASKAKDGHSIVQSGQAVKRNPTRSKRSRKKTETDTSGADKE